MPMSVYIKLRNIGFDRRAISTLMLYSINSDDCTVMNRLYLSRLNFFLSSHGSARIYLHWVSI